MPRTRTAPPASRRSYWKITDARAALGALSASGLTVNAFARREGMDPKRLRRWRLRLAAESQHQVVVAAPEVIEVRTRRPEPVEVVLLSGRVVRVSETIDPSVLTRLVAAPERTGC